MNMFTYEDFPSNGKNSHKNNNFVVKGLTDNGVGQYLTNKNSMAYNFLQKNQWDMKSTQKSNSNNGFFATAIDVKTTKNGDIKFPGKLGIEV